MEPINMDLKDSLIFSLFENINENKKNDLNT